MKKFKCNDEHCECMNEEVPTTNVSPTPKDGKKKAGIILGIGAGIAAVGAAIAGIFIAKKKAEKEEEFEDE